MNTDRRPLSPSPSERHPGKKPEDANPDYDDLKVRDDGNKRGPSPAPKKSP